MIALPKDMNWKNFATYIASKYDWFAVDTDAFFPSDNGKKMDSVYRRIDHLLSDLYVDGDKIMLRIQKGDSFLEGLNSFIVTLNGVIRKKYDCYFVVEEVDHF